MRLQLSVCAAVLLISCLAEQASAVEFTVEPSEKGALVKIDGELFTEYITDSSGKPVLWPVIGPTGKPMTRAFPLAAERVAGENSDHSHHRSLWFTHGSINGVDFWTEQNGVSQGNTRHREFVTLQGGETGLIVTRNEWEMPDGSIVLSDQRTIRMGADADQRWIDFAIKLTPTTGEVRFGDTKEGSFGIRVAGPMKMTARQGGTIVNNRGQTGGDTWGQQAEWVDYNGPVERGGERLGIAILNHPSSFRFPTYWHVRDYGLFAANPFGLHDFKNLREPEGEYTLAQGETMQLRYRVILHKGDPTEAHLEEQYQGFVADSSSPAAVSAEAP